MFKFFVELKWFFKRNLIKYIIIGVVSIAYTYLVTIPPSIIGQFVDKITYQSLSKTFVYQIFFLMLGVTISIYTTSLLKKIMLGNLYHSLFYKLKNIYLESIFKQDGDFFEKYHSGDLISRAMGDNRMVANTSTHLVFSILDTITMLLVVSVQMIIINPRLTILSVIPLPLILVLILYLRPKISRNWRLVRNEHSHLNNLVMESVANVKMIRGFTNEIKDQQKLDDSANTVYKIERKSILMQSVISPSFQIITLISQGIALSFGAYFIMKQTLSPGQLITFYLYLGMFAGPLLSLGNQITALSQSSVSLDRFNEILNAFPAIDKPNSPVKLNEIEVIKFDNVSFKYPKSSEYAIKNINLEIKKGTTLGIVGKIGSGKTTIIRQLLRQYPIVEGNIYINDNNINDYDKEEVRFKIGYVPQEHVLFSRSVLENLKLGLNEKSIYSKEEAVTIADFEKDLKALEKGFETIVGEKGVTLSGGQKQRLSIARAILKSADVLIMDDSLSAVDGVTEANILSNLNEMRKGKTNIIVAHRLTAVENADNIIVLENGEIVEQGTHIDLVNNKKWYYSQYIIQKESE